MKRGGFLPRYTPIERKSRIRKGTKGFRRYEGQEGFREAVLKRDGLSRPCVVGCGRVAVEAHHIVYKRTLSNFLDLYDIEEYPLERQVTDPRNGLPLCRHCHDNHHNASQPIPRELIPEVAWDFARELRLDWWLERHYPKRRAA